MLSHPACRERGSPPRPRLELADIFREYAGRLGAVGPEQLRVIRDITRCRTAALGGHVRKCMACDYVEQSYNSCRNRHCPKCQSLKKAQWLEDRMADLLPVHYFHVVFTVPRGLNPLILRNQRTLYGILFRAAAETLREVAADPRHLGARIGFTAILHTWSQTLVDHPHLHCVVPGGGVSPDRRSWIGCPEDFFLPVRVLSVVFRGKFLDYTQRAFQAGQLTFPGQIRHLEEPAAFNVLLKSVCQSKWVVFAKHPFAGPKQVLEYLGRYTHRVAISNNRLVQIHDGKVTFTWKDYRGNHAPKTMTLEAAEFMRRFLLHVLPKRFVRIRHYGFLGNPVHTEAARLIKRLLGVDCEEQDQTSETLNETWQGMMLRITGTDPTLCPRCRKGDLVECQILMPQTYTRHTRGQWGPSP